MSVINLFRTDRIIGQNKSTKNTNKRIESTNQLNLLIYYSNQNNLFLTKLSNNNLNSILSSEHIHQGIIQDDIRLFIWLFFGLLTFILQLHFRMSLYNLIETQLNNNIALTHFTLFLTIYTTDFYLISKEDQHI
jgi:hypothetical protein